MAADQIFEGSRGAVSERRRDSGSGSGANLLRAVVRTNM